MFPDRAITPIPLSEVLSGSATWAGKKHEFNQELNEDNGAIGACTISDRISSVSVRAAWVFDGHGPPMVGGMASPGKLVSFASMHAHQAAVAQALPRIIYSPLLPPYSSKFFTHSQQAQFAETFNAVDVVTRSALPNVLTDHAGTSASCVMALQNAEDPQLPIRLLACNLGDSRIVLVHGSYNNRHHRHHRRKGIAAPTTTVEVLSEEENCCEPDQQRWIYWRCAQLGYVAAETTGVHRRSEKAVTKIFYPSSLVGTPMDIGRKGPFNSLEHLRRTLDELPVGANYDSTPPHVIALSAPYLWRLDMRPKGQQLGLQMTGSIGDRRLEPIKKYSRWAADVRARDLVAKRGVVTVAICASDGLWETVGRKSSDLEAFGRLVIKFLTSQKGDIYTPAAYNRLACHLAVMGGSKKRDDVTVTVLGFVDREPKSPHYDGTSKEGDNSSVLPKKKEIIPPVQPINPLDVRHSNDDDVPDEYIDLHNHLIHEMTSRAIFLHGL